MLKKSPFLWSSLILTLFLAACKPTQKTTPYLAPGSDPLSILPATPLPSPSPTATRAPSPTPTPDPTPLTATVWESLPQVPILMYHRFNPDPEAASENFITALSDFDRHMNELHEAGFSLIALDAWLRGEIHPPAGRRPLIITLDDLFYADQISLDDTGKPAEYSGIGRLWHFSQTHPDFGFHAALFFNFGDKAYSNIYTDGQFSVGDGWRTDRARAIVWGIRNGALPYNHTYEHPFLNTLEPEEIQWQLEENDRALREALALVGEEELAADLPNILALPYVIWPETEEGREVLFNYQSPEGVGVSAILEGDYAENTRLFPAPFSNDFDPWHVPRVAGSDEAVAMILEKLPEIPAAAQCPLGEFPETVLADGNGDISVRILELTDEGVCPFGYYIVKEHVFHVGENGIIQILP
jgi:peptidoglycan/xylan/chitin deacetylase (PgdA/CDA1 family)